MARVLLKEISKTFDRAEVVHGISLDIAHNEFVVLVGPSGCGKSTTLRMIAGLEEITAGDIYIGERLINDVPPKDRDIAMVFQNYALYPHMTVFENMSFGLRLRKTPKVEIKARVEEAANILNIHELLDRRPRQLSGGQRQRVAMGRAIVRHPQVFLFDEPLSNLDAKLRVQMRSELQSLHQRLKTTTLYVTHDQVEAMTLAHRMLVMNAGKTEQIGRPLEVYTKPATTFVAGFIGSPPMNLIPGRLTDGGKMLAGNGSARLRLPEPRPAYDGRNVLLGVRPEHFETCEKDAALLTPDIDFIELLGSDSLVYGHLDSGQDGARIAARLHVSAVAKEGRLPLRFSAEHMHLFDAESGKRIEA